MSALSVCLESRMPHYDEGSFGERGFTDRDRDNITTLLTRMEMVLERVRDMDERVRRIEDNRASREELAKLADRVSAVENKVILWSGIAMGVGTVIGFLIKLFVH